MKLRTLACMALACCAFGAGTVGAQREAREQNLRQSAVTSVGAFVDKWQQRITTQNLVVADPQNWAARNLAKFSSFSAERLELAMQATSIGELEALLVSAPLANGTSLALLMATKPGNISVDALSRQVSQGAVTKADPTSAPATYADLLFTSLNPCRILDSRVSQGGSGPFVNGLSRPIKIGPYAGPAGYASGNGAQGGSSTGCGLDTLASSNQIAAVMVAVTSFSQTGNGYLTFSSFDTPDPSLSVVSMFYQAGVLQTAFVVMPTDTSAPVWSKGISRNANTEVTLDIVGYFAKPHAAALDCSVVLGPGTVIPAAGTGSDTAPACAAGYSRTGLSCNTSNVLMDLAGLSGATCSWNNNDASPGTGTAIATCCRVAGR